LEGDWECCPETEAEADLDQLVFRKRRTRPGFERSETTLSGIFTRKRC
jgi:hypothetical protein